jgi:hypothetical protein
MRLLRESLFHFLTIDALNDRQWPLPAFCLIDFPMF